MQRLKGDTFQVLFAILLVIFLKDIAIIGFFIFFLFKIVKGEKPWYFKSLFYFFIFRFLNPLLFNSSGLLLPLGWIILFVVFAKSLTYIQRVELSRLRWYYLFVFICLFSSLFKSEYLSISIFKLITFFVGFVTIFINLHLVDKLQVFNFLICTWLVFILLSLPTLFVTSIGYARNGSGFQGITNQPNFYGPFNALIGGTILIINYNLKILNIKKSVQLVLVVLNLLFVFLSESRTALIMLIILSLCTFVLVNKNNLKILAKSFPYIIISSFLTLSVFLINYDKISNVFINFMVKDRAMSSNTLTFDQFSRTRTGLIETSLENFNENPLIGNGFASPSGYYDFEIKYLNGTNIPISATIEKGNLYSQILEETGIIGLTIFLIFLIFTIIKVLKSNPELLGLVIGPIILNFGEASFFSANGQGFFLWTLFLLPYFFKKHEIKNMYMAA
jgi:O-antigen ligase